MTVPATSPVQDVRALIAKGDIAAATRACDAYLADVTPNAETFILEGLRHSANGRLNEAVTSYDTALSLAPDALAAYQGIAEILALRGWFFSAALVMEDARKSAALTPEAQEQLSALRGKLESIVRSARGTRP